MLHECSVFNENLTMLCTSFEDVLYRNSSRGFYYFFPLKQDYAIKCQVFLDKDRFTQVADNIFSTCWLISIESSDPSKPYYREIKADFSQFDSLDDWVCSIERDPVFDDDALDLVSWFIVIFWSSVFRRRTKNLGLLTGAWASGIRILRDKREFIEF